MKNIFIVALMAFFLTASKCISAQDVWLQNHFSPNSGCHLSNSETVTVLVNNNSGVVMPSNTITVSYTVNGGSIVNQFLSSNLFPGASWNFSFTAKANLSACGTHTLKVWVTRPGDVNQLNDTLVWFVYNDCAILPGKISGDTNVCEGRNNGILSLKGNQYGTISGWQSSIDSGKTWSTVSNNTTSLNYNNVTVNTKYRVLIDGGFCPDAVSDTAELSVVKWRRGSLLGSDSLYAPATGSIRLQGASHPVVFWESLDTITNVWDTIQQTDTILTFSNLNVTTKYRATTGGGVCAEALTDTATITILYHNVGIIDEKVSGYILYPNPATDVLTLQYKEQKMVEVIIVNSLGQVVLAKMMSGTGNAINTSTLDKGMYCLIVRDADGVNSTMKFVKE